MKRDDSKAAVRGRKVGGPAVYKNVAEFNEICTRSQWRGLHSGQTNHEAKSKRVGSSPWGGQMRVRKAGERYKQREEKSEGIALSSVENSTPLPHMVHSNHILVFKHEFLANE